ncbi:MAG: cyclodeaminase/cyclohydrolase family protein, partial [Acidobacteria bacterium]|nr:cyclodeaminase/cyclohydrolase family protein [Acidobacteriota bacterium]
SELVGLIPMEALLMAGRHYLEKQGKSPGVSKEELINIAALSLGLGDVAPFEPEKKIIEYQFKEVDNSLLDLNLRQFANELSSESPAPGGGSAAALAGALSASLSAMVSNLTVGKKDYEDVQSKVIELAVRGQNLKDEFLRDVDLDTIAFNRVMDAIKMTKKTDEQKLARNNAMEKATKEATLVPLSVLERCLDAISLSLEIARIGNKNSISDAGVAGLMARAAALGAYYNVLINLPGIRDEKFKTDTRTKAESFRNKVEEQADIVAEIIESELQVSG